MIATSTGSKMRAIVCERPTRADQLKIGEIERPAVPEDGVLVRVHASSANPVDLFPMTTAGYLAGGRKPHVLGTDFAGTVESVGNAVTQFEPGDEVFGGRSGAFAEYLCVREHGAIARVPSGVSFEDSGTVAVAATTSLQALRDHGRLQAGQSVLINGASGGVGTFAVQIAKALGAHVTAVCSTRNVDMVRSIGADAVIDYTREDFTRVGERYDLIADIAGTHSLWQCRRVLKRTATFVGVGAAGVQHLAGGGLRALGHFLNTRMASMAGSQKVVVLFIARLNRQDLDVLGELLASGQVTPVIDRRYDLGSVPKALEYMNEGHARAKVAISVGP